MSGVGRIFKRKMKLRDGSIVEDPHWQIEWRHRGRPYRRSSHSTSEVIAKRKLKEKLDAISKGRFVPNEEKLTFEQIKEDLKTDYKVQDNRSLSTMLYCVRHLEKFFGFDRAIDITSDRVREYQAARLAEGASRATVNREVAYLGRMLSLAANADPPKISRKPKFPMLDESDNVRQGFVEHGDFVKLLRNLPEYLMPLIEFLYLSGWRKREGVNADWAWVNMQSKTITLPAKFSKNKEPRELPLMGRLLEIIRDRFAERRLGCPYVFHNEGRPLINFRRAWRTACIKSGLGRIEKLSGGKKKYVGTIPHDLRRCAARNLSRAGISEQVAMEVMGHKTRSMYRRYRIVDDREKREALDKVQAHLANESSAQGTSSKVAG
jgi:integrase